MKIAIIGGGIAGLGAAWLLAPHHDIQLYEKNDYPGGHSNTAEISRSGQPIPADTGFIVYNERNYPHLTQLFRHLHVDVTKSDMSFGVSLNDGELEYSGRSLSGLLAQPSNLLRPAFWRMLKDILRFNRHAPALLAEPNATEVTLGQFLQRHGYGESFIRGWLLPMGAAIWSSTLEKMMDFPALTFIRFFQNHGLLTVADQPQWYTVTGGSREYVKKLTASFSDHIRLSCPAMAVTREEDGVRVKARDGSEEKFDQVVLAAHADETLGMLTDPSAEERRLLGAFPYQPNRAVLHCDPSLMPKRRAAWSSWNYLSSAESGTDRMILTYWMNSLQPIDKDFPVFVTLNPAREPAPHLTYGEYHYHHPLFSREGLEAQPLLPNLQGKRRTWFCGAYHRYGFHEDALASGIAAANGLGVKAPWQASTALM